MGDHHPNAHSRAVCGHIICCPPCGQGQSSGVLLGTYGAGAVCTALWGCDGDKDEYFDLKERVDCLVREKRRALKSTVL